MNLGAYDKSKAGHDEWYHAQRYTDLDFRGPMSISPLSIWGYFNRVITWTHVLKNGTYSEEVINAPVIVEDYAFITSYCILHNCVIGHHAVVSIGSVVNGTHVLPYTIVSGNPAVAVAMWDEENQRWRRLRR